MIGLDANVLGHGTSLVVTDTIDLLLAAGPMALTDRFIVALDGPPGCGKTTALTTFIARQNAPVHAISLDPGSSDKDVVRQLHDAVVGKPVAANKRRVDLLADVRVALAGTSCLVVIDEAQNAGNSALEMIRHLHMEPTASWHLVIAGVDLQARLGKEKKLASRVGHWSLFRPLAGAELLAVLKGLHPVLANADPDLLLAADKVACKGVLREWVKLTAVLARLTAGAPPTRQHLQDALTSVTGQRVKLPSR